MSISFIPLTVDHYKSLLSCFVSFQSLYFSGFFYTMCFSALMHNMQIQTFYTNPGFDDYKKHNTVQQNESLALREALFQFLLVWLKSASQKLPKPDCFKALFWSAFNGGFVKENYPKGLKLKSKKMSKKDEMA